MNSNLQGAAARLVVRDVPLQQLHVNDRNPRTIDPERLEALKKSLVADPEMLTARPVIATPDGCVIAGNMRLQAARALGWGTIPTVVVELDESRARLWMLKDNQQYGHWVEAELGALLEELASVGVDLDLTGFAGHEIDDLMRGLVQAQRDIDPDDIPRAPEPLAKPGDIWALGEHRLACGDATDYRLVATLCEQDRVDLVWTDPPYGVDYEGKTPAALKLRNDALTHDRHERLLLNVFSRTLEVCRPGAVWYVCAPSSPPQVLAFVSALRALSLWQQTLVWVKDSFVLGHSDFHYRHELLFYGWAPGSHRSPPQRNHDTVWEIERPKASRDHPTAKPVALVKKALEVSSRPQAIVFDPFLGSGTTLIAAELTRRRCIGIEIDPRYVDVALGRYQQMTGKEPVRVRQQQSARDGG